VAASGPQRLDLETKCRIPVEQGVTLMGVLDELDDLEEGQVFMQVGPAVGAVASLVRV
jgi:hypothetical protein